MHIFHLFRYPRLAFLVAAIGLGIFGPYLLFTYFTHSAEQERQAKVAIAKQLLDHGLVTSAWYDEAHPYRNGNYTIGYNFYVNHKVYKDTETRPDEPRENDFDLTYLPENPDVHQITPAAVLEANKHAKDETPDLLGGLAFVAISIGLFFYLRVLYKDTSGGENLLVWFVKKF